MTEDFRAYLHVCYGRYLALQAEGLIPADTRIPIRSLYTDWVLAAAIAGIEGTWRLYRPLSPGLRSGNT